MQRIFDENICLEESQTHAWMPALVIHFDGGSKASGIIADFQFNVAPDVNKGVGANKMWAKGNETVKANCEVRAISLTVLCD